MARATLEILIGAQKNKQIKAVSFVSDSAVVKLYQGHLL
jgi:hypothetical protein